MCAFLPWRCKSAVAAVSVLAVFLSGCGPARNKTTAEEIQAPANSATVFADAYLFDAVLKKEGKTTSFRLEMYVTDSAVGLAGRGYLGKGALRGVLKTDLLTVYFPSTNEYVDADLKSLLSDSTCPIELSGFDPVKYMSAVPDTAAVRSPLVINQIKQSENRKEFRVTAGCDWILTLAYDRRDRGWRPIELKFETTSGTILRAVRREFRPHSRVNSAKFSSPIPTDANRLVP